MQRPVRIPAAIVIGVTSAVVGSAVFSLAAALFMRPDTFDGESSSFTNLIRWQNFAHGAGVASTLLIASGLFFIASRLSRWQRSLIQIAAWFQLGWLAWTMARPMLFQLVSNPDTIELLSTWVWRLIAIAMFGSLVLVTIAVRAWWRPRSALVPIAAVVMVVLETISWAPWISTAIHELRHEHERLYQLIWPVREVLSGGAFLLLVHALMHDTTEPLPNPNAASGWFNAAHVSILVRIVFAVVLALAGMARVPGVTKLVLVGGPLINVAMIMLFAWSIVSVERAALPGMPRIRLLLGGAIAAWGAAITMQQAVSLYSMLGRDSYGGFDSDAATVWSLAGPLIGIAGMVLVCSAVASFASTRGNESLREMAIARAVIHGVLVLVIMVMPYAMAKVTSSGTLIMVSLLLAGAVIASQAVIAGVMRRAAESIEPTPTIPQARLR